MAASNWFYSASVIQPVRCLERRLSRYCSQLGGSNCLSLNLGRPCKSSELALGTLAAGSRVKKSALNLKFCCLSLVLSSPMTRKGLLLSAF